MALPDPPVSKIPDHLFEIRKSGWFPVARFSLIKKSSTDICSGLRHDFLNQPIHVQVGNTSSLSANEDISQEVWMLNSAEDKDAALVEALQLYGGPGQRILVFVAMKKQCDVGASVVWTWP